MKKTNKLFESICRKSQKELKKYLTKELANKGYTPISGDGYIYAKGTFPVMLVAHMDTVHKELVKQIVYSSSNNIISSPQGIGGDDRAGIYMILKIIEQHKCTVLFVEDEEIGCIGSRKFAKTDLCKGIKDINYIIELDRMGQNDAVFYECDNPEFEDFILKDKAWQLNYGTYTDIVELAPVIGVAAVNFSCGYYNPHTTREYVKLDEMEDNIVYIGKLLDRTTENDKFEYIEKVWLNSHGWSGYNWNWKDDETEIYDGTYYICAFDKQGKMIEDELCAYSMAEAVGQFLVDHPNLCYNDIVDILNEDEC